MARFSNLKMTATYMVTSPEDGSELSSGMQGTEVSRIDWPDGAEAWEIGGDEDKPAAVAE